MDQKGVIMDSIKKALQSIPRVPLIPQPTPLHPLKHFCQDHQTGVYIKRDDLTGLGPGGNKLRPLEFILGQALAKRADYILVAGPGQSNLCSLTAATCARLSLPCRVIVNCKEPERLEGNLLLNQLLGAEIIYAGDVDSQKRALKVGEEYTALKNSGHSPFIVENGATTGCGILGYTVAVAEMLEQCQKQNISKMTIFVPGGNGGVAAGLIYGNALLDFPFDLVIISVEDDKDTLTQHIKQVIAEAEKLTGIETSPWNRHVSIDDTYRGAGWGCNTEKSSAMVPHFARVEGILIENVYNSKVLVAMEDYIQKDKVKGPVCFLHTGGFGSLFSQY